MGISTYIYSWWKYYGALAQPLYTCIVDRKETEIHTLPVNGCWRLSSAMACYICILAYV